ncbi:MAG TPA: tetratricopeptide repeat protein [Methylophilaceae bacterium]|nr:tetratricopeptide repeat protein [Methylophilaceae bacterium]
MLTDKQGNELPGATREAAEFFDQAVEMFNIYRGNPLTCIDNAINAAPEFTMAHVLKALLLILSTEPAAISMAREIAEKLKSMHLSEREASLVAALEQLLAGNWVDAAVAMDQHNIDYPYDVVAIQFGHLLDFYRANRRNLRDRIARILPKWSASMPAYPILLGMYSFGLEETGDYARAEEIGRQAVELQPLDCWAHHAVTHVMEMQGRPDDGIVWMISRKPYWSGDDNFFQVHNWWHYALFHLELDQADDALSLYDSAVRQNKSLVALELIDASALLWRLHLAGVDVSDRWQEVAAAWDQHADAATYPFNDWHAVMAYLGAGRSSDVENMLVNLRNTSAGQTDIAEWTRRNGLPLVEGFIAFWRGDYSSAIDRLYGARYVVNSFGGSNAQHDITDLTLTEAAIRGGFNDLAEALTNERLALKPHSTINHKFFSRSKSMSISK